MPMMPKVHRPLGAPTPAERARVDVDRRGSSHERGYTTKRWGRERKRWLAEHPLCVLCEKRGRLTPANVVDHIIPHRGNEALFWDWEHNWQSLCEPCHNGPKRRQELAAQRRGTVRPASHSGAAGRG